MEGHDTRCTCDVCRAHRGALVNAEPDFDPPEGWVEIQRDDSPDFEPELVEFFADDGAAAVRLSSAARWFNPDSGESCRVESPLGQAVTNGTAWDRARAIIPALEAEELGLVF